MSLNTYGGTHLVTLKSEYILLELLLMCLLRCLQQLETQTCCTSGKGLCKFVLKCVAIFH